MGGTEVNVAELIGSRICHDLISPIGAVTNGLELLEMVGSMQGPELELISGSIASAAAKIRFFRVAFGAASDQPLGRAEVGSLLTDIEKASRVRVHWNITQPVPRNQVKLAFLAILCCENAMPLGGMVEVKQSGDSWNVAGTADKLNVDINLWKALPSGRFATKVTPAQVQFVLLPETASTMGRRVSVDTSLTQILIRF